MSQPFNGLPWQPAQTQRSPLCMTGLSLLCNTGSPYKPYKAHPEIPGLVKYYFSPSTLPSPLDPPTSLKEEKHNAAVGGLKRNDAYSILL